MASDLVPGEIYAVRCTPVDYVPARGVNGALLRLTTGTVVMVVEKNLTASVYSGKPMYVVSCPQGVATLNGLWLGPVQGDETVV